MKTRAKRRRNKIRWMIPVSIALIGGVCLWIERPMDELLQVQIRQQAIQTANDAVYDAAEQLLEQWDPAETVRVYRNEAGVVQSMETDTAQLNQMQTELNRLVQKTLKQTETAVMRVPVGTLLGWSLLRERGPAVTVRFALNASAQCTLSNRFSEAGVNQTLHEIWLETELTFYAMLPGANQAETVTISYCLAQTVIVGQVPSVALK